MYHHLSNNDYDYNHLSDNKADDNNVYCNNGHSNDHCNEYGSLNGYVNTGVTHINVHSIQTEMTPSTKLEGDVCACLW